MAKSNLTIFSLLILSSLAPFVISEATAVPIRVIDCADCADIQSFVTAAGSDATTALQNARYVVVSQSLFRSAIVDVTMLSLWGTFIPKATAVTTSVQELIDTDIVLIGRTLLNPVDRDVGDIPVGEIPWEGALPAGVGTAVDWLEQSTLWVNGNPNVRLITGAGSIAMQKYFSLWNRLLGFVMGNSVIIYVRFNYSDDSYIVYKVTGASALNVTPIYAVDKNGRLHLGPLPPGLSDEQVQGSATGTNTQADVTGSFPNLWTEENTTFSVNAPSSLSVPGQVQIVVCYVGCRAGGSGVLAVLDPN